MAKLDIDFILLDESVVMYGFRALMSGAQLEAFKQNPVMLLMHGRAEQGYSKPLEEDVVLPIGKWYDIRIEGNKLLAKPEFDDDDDFAKKVESKVKKGYLNAASIWIDPIAATDDEAYMLPGQTSVTITKWGLFEASIVDIPNCKNALAIRNSAGQKVALSGNAENEDVNNYLTSLIQSTNMDKKLMATKLGLSENAADNEISQKLAAVLADAAKVPGLDAEVSKLKTYKTELEAKLALQEKEAGERKNAELVDGAIAAKKLAAGDRETYITLAASNFDATKKLIDGLPAYTGVENKLTVGGAGTDTDTLELNELLKLSGRTLYMEGKLQRLKVLSEPHYKLKYKEYFGSEPM